MILLSMLKMRSVLLMGAITLIDHQQNIQIKSHMTPSGLLFATLSLDTPSFEEFFPGLEDLTNKVDFTTLPHRRSISYEGRFNWKTMCAEPFLSAQHEPDCCIGLTASKNAFIASTHTLRFPSFIHLSSTR